MKTQKTFAVTSNTSHRDAEPFRYEFTLLNKMVRITKVRWNIAGADVIEHSALRSLTNARRAWTALIRYKNYVPIGTIPSIESKKAINLARRRAASAECPNFW